ncbi:MAG: glycosyltransferase [bacterium]|nr:glycosyltransferase [bacterium]
MAYRFLIVDTYYPKFLEKFHNFHNQDSSYDEHWQALMDELFGTSDFYSKNLKKLGCEAREIVFNSIILQQKWIQEHGFKKGYSLFYRNPLGFKIINRLPIIPWEYKLPYKILKAQIDFYKPDILYVQDITAIDDTFLHEIKNSIKLIIGQTACPLPTNINLKFYDLILTSFPHFVSRFRKDGINSEYFRIAFEPTVLEKVGTHNRSYNCTFIGGITKAHRYGTELLEELAKKVDIDFFGYGIETLSKNSVIRKKHHGEVWGKDMYKIMTQSKITINRHIDTAENFANNMRLYEATGCGAMLITDMKDNLNKLFDIGEEVVAYNNVNELVELIKYYTSQDSKREKIAIAGQKKTIAKHTYYNRMEEILDIIPKYIK